MSHQYGLVYSYPSADSREAKQETTGNTLSDDQKAELNESIALVTSQIDTMKKDLIGLEGTLVLYSAQASPAKENAVTLRQLRQGMLAQQRTLGIQFQDMVGARKSIVAGEQRRVQSEKQELEKARTKATTRRSFLANQQPRNDNAITRVDQTIAQLNKSIVQIDSELEEIDERIKTQDVLIAAHKEAMLEWESKIVDLDKAIADNDIKISEQDETPSSSDAQERLANHKAVVTQHRADIENLEQKLAKLQTTLVGETVQHPSWVTLDTVVGSRSFQNPDGSTATVAFTSDGGMKVRNDDGNLDVLGAGGMMLKGGCSATSRPVGERRLAHLCFDPVRESGVLYICGGRVDWTINQDLRSLKTLKMTTGLPNVQITIHGALSAEISG